MTNIITDTDGTVHEFRISGCASQWHRDHSFPQCWKAFMRFHGLPETTTVAEFYDR